MEPLTSVVFCLVGALKGESCFSRGSLHLPFRVTSQEETSTSPCEQPLTVVESDTPRSIAQAILARRRLTLLRRLPQTDRETLPDSPVEDRRRWHIWWHDWGTAAMAALLLTALGALLIAQIKHIEALVLSAWIGCLASVAFNNTVHIRARRLHARQESARLDYECRTLPDEQQWAISRVEKLLERLDRQERLLVQNLLRNVFLSLVLVIPALGTAITLSIQHAHVKGPIAAVLFELLAIVGFLLARNRARELENAAQQADYELNLMTPWLGVEQRAERLYLKQQFELKRYYDEALRQSTSLSYIGAGCILGGFVVIGVTLGLVASGKSGSTVAIAVIGGVGGILANFVAVVFLQMHSSTIRALSSFQDRFVVTNHLHFANLLVARIGSDHVEEMQAQAIADLARAVAGFAPEPEELKE